MNKLATLAHRVEIVENRRGGTDTDAEQRRRARVWWTSMARDFGGDATATGRACLHRAAAGEPIPRPDRAGGFDDDQ